MSWSERKFAEADGTDAMRSPRVFVVEFLDESGSFDVFVVDPGVFLIPIAFPGNEELKFPAENPAV